MEYPDPPRGQKFDQRQWKNINVPPTLDEERLRQAGVEPPKTRPVPPSQALAYEMSPEGQASKQQFNQARAQQAGVGSQYRGAGPMGNNAAAGAAAEAEAAARYQQQTGRAAPGAGAGAAPGAAPKPQAAPGAAANAGKSTLRQFGAKVVPYLGGGALALGKGGLKWGARGAATQGVVMGTVDTLQDASTGYRDHFANSVGVDNSSLGSSLVADGVRYLTNIGNATTGGYAERAGRGLSSFFSGGTFSEGFNEPTHRDAYGAARGQPQNAAAAAAQSEAKTDGRNPHASANQAKLDAFALAEKQRAESEQLRQMGESFESRPGSNMARPDLGYGPIADRTKLTNERAAEMNPAGVVKVTKGASGNPEFSGMDLRGQVSYAGADGKALPDGGLGGGFSSFAVAPAGSNVVLGPNGSYAFATSGSGTRSAEQLQQDIANSKQQVAAQAQRLGVDIAGMSPVQAMQYMGEVENARAINAAGAAAAAEYDRSGKWMNDLRDPRTMALRNASVGPTIFRNRRERDAAMKERQKKYEDTWNLVAGAADREATRELEYAKSANTLRGQEMQANASMYSSDNTLRGAMYSADEGAATAAAKARQDRDKDVTAAQAKAREETVNMFRREGDKDIGAAEQRVNVADQVLPGFSTMDTASKARARPTVESAVDLYDRMKSQTPQGLWEKLTSSDKPGLTGLPSIQGWKVDRSFGGDHYITNPKTKQTITLGSGLNEMQLKMLENATRTGSFIPQAK